MASDRRPPAPEADWVGKAETCQVTQDDAEEVALSYAAEGCGREVLSIEVRCEVEDQVICVSL